MTPFPNPPLLRGLPSALFRCSLLAMLLVLPLSGRPSSTEIVPRGDLVPEQSFTVDFAGYGRVTFATYHDLDNSPPNVHFYLLRDGKVIHELPDFYGNQLWAFDEVDAVAFRDVNGDGLKDILIIAEYITGAGPGGAEPFRVIDVFFRGESGFYREEAISELLNNSENYSRLVNIARMTKYLRGLDLQEILRKEQERPAP